MIEHFPLSQRMRWLAVVFGLAFLFLAFTVPALAGGWAVVTLDQVPGEIRAGEPYTLGFMLRQHGRSPFSSHDVEVQLRHLETGESQAIYAQPEGREGHHVATFTLTEPGEWALSISTGPFPGGQVMPNLTVTPAVTATGPSLPTANVSGPLLGLLGLGLAGGAAYLSRRGRSRRVLAGVGIGILLIGWGLFTTMRNPENPARAAADSPYTPSAEEIYIAKGCPVCHFNSNIDTGNTNAGIGTAPNLTDYTSSPEFLRIWLADPASVRPHTTMPDLDLSDEEIEILISLFTN